MHNLSKSQLGLSWVLQLAAAGILLQTLFFKFTAAEESVYIFTALGAAVAFILPGRPPTWLTYLRPRTTTSTRSSRRT